MNAHLDSLDAALERLRRRASPAHQPERPTPTDPQVQALAALARAWQSAPALQADPTFADHLERRLLAQQAALAPQRAAPRGRAGLWHWPWRAQPALRLALALALLTLLLGSGVLLAAAQVTNPTNPLYALKHWEQQVQGALSGSSADQAEGDLQAARDQLQRLPPLADAAHAGPYRQALAAFDAHLRRAAQAIAALPPGPDLDRLRGELTSLRSQARLTLRGLLLSLAVPERQATTDELARLGDTVPHLFQVEVTLPAHPNGQASVSLSGDDLQAGAVLLVEGRPVTASGAPQRGGYLFTLNWKGNQHPHSLGVMNPDGTVAQTTTITWHAASDGNGNGNGNNPGGGKRQVVWSQADQRGERALAHLVFAVNRATLDDHFTSPDQASVHNNSSRIEPATTHLQGMLDALRERQSITP